MKERWISVRGMSRGLAVASDGGRKVVAAVVEAGCWCCWDCCCILCVRAAEGCDVDQDVCRWESWRADSDASWEKSVFTRSITNSAGLV